MNRDTSESLKACPFCGGTNLKLYATLVAGRGSRRGVITCQNPECGCRLEDVSGLSLGQLPDDMGIQEKYDMLQADAKRRIAEKWNRRAS